VQHGLSLAGKQVSFKHVQNRRHDADAVQGEYLVLSARAGAARSSRMRARRRWQDFPIRISYPVMTQPVTSFAVGLNNGNTTVALQRYHNVGLARLFLRQ
jgi:hypothetical protein